MPEPLTGDLDRTEVLLRRLDFRDRLGEFGDGVECSLAVVDEAQRRCWEFRRSRSRRQKMKMAIRRQYWSQLLGRVLAGVGGRAALVSVADGLVSTFVSVTVLLVSMAFQRLSIFVELSVRSHPECSRRSHFPQCLPLPSFALGLFLA
jgi:hypothetical protein